MAHSKHSTNVSNDYYTYNHNRNRVVSVLKEMLNAEEIHRKESLHPPGRTLERLHEIGGV